MCREVWRGANRFKSLPALATRSGFTLIEMMIVVVIVAILAVVVLPSYQSYVMKARRTEAKAALTTVAQTLERYATENGILGYTLASLNDTPGDRVVAKVTTESGYYELSFANDPTLSAFELRATPKNAQVNDRCGIFRINQRGEREVTNTFGKTKEECWQ